MGKRQEAMDRKEQEKNDEMHLPNRPALQVRILKAVMTSNPFLKPFMVGI